MQARKTLENCKWKLMDESGGSSKNQNANRTVDSKNWTHEV